MLMTMKNSRSKGFTLVELMVAVAIGLLITLVVTQAYINGIGTQQAQTGISRAQESSRFAFDNIGHALRKAGFRNPRSQGADFCSNAAPFRLNALNDQSSITLSSAEFSSSSGNPTATVLNSSDVFRIRYYGEGLTNSPFTPDGTITDCQGNAIASNVRVEDTYFIAADSNNDNEPALFCHSTNTWAAVALVPGVESMQLLFGDDTDLNGVTDRYVQAANVSSMTNVRSAIVSLITRTKETSVVDRSTWTINHFDSYSGGSADAGATFTAPADGRVRQHATFTVALRNICPI